MTRRIETTPILIWVERKALSAKLSMSESPLGVLLLPRLSHREKYSRRFVDYFCSSRIATLVVDLLDADEEQFDSRTMHFHTQPKLLVHRLIAGVEALRSNKSMAALPRAIFASGVVASAAVRALRRRPDLVDTLVCWNGRFETVADERKPLAIPVLLLVRDDDPALVRENRLVCEWISEDAALDFIFEPADSATENDVVSHKARRWMMGTLRRSVNPVSTHEEDAKGATEEMMERIDVIDGFESLGYDGGGRGEHSGECGPVESDDPTAELADNDPAKLVGVD